MREVKERKILNNKTGFAMLFAVLTASLLLTIGISIFSISFKELTISTAARESQIAFYAADSARECALYWDVKKGAFPACLDTKDDCTKTSPSLGNIMCNGVLVDGLHLSQSRSGPGNITYTSSTSTQPFIKYDGELDPEADVIVSKTYNPATHNIETTITAYGHNVSASGRRLERGISQTY
ncbi:MAG: hypothetical protein WC631_02130 [Candidatus Paceibacterota bacterium]